MHRAYSTIDIKSAATAADGKRRFSGIASTPSTDRMGDIIEPLGAEFALPIPLLWQHNSREPIGRITKATLAKNGITVEGEVESIDEPGKLKELLDFAWQSIKAQLVRGLSIGFSPIESARIENTYGYRFTKWAWHELSAVTIPANADCSITAIKSADQAIRRAASGARPVVRLDTAPAAPGNLQPGDSGHPAGRTRKPGVVYLK